MAEDYIKRKNGKEKIKYLHPLLEPILERHLRGDRLPGAGDADRADSRRLYHGRRRYPAPGHGQKDPEEMAAQRERLSSGAVAKNDEEKRATEIFDQMETFARYGFNKSHSAAYALVSYQTAYLKTHYPVEFMAALLTSEMGDTDKVIKNLAECRDKDIEVLAPDVNESGSNFTPGGRQRSVSALAAVKNVGEKARGSDP